MKDKIIDKIKDNAITIILGLALLAGQQIWGYIQKGAEADIMQLIDSRIDSKVSDSELVKTLLESEHVKEFTDEAGQSIRAAIIEDVTAVDSNKINQNAYLGKELGIRDEAVTPLLRDMLKDYNDGKLVTKTELDAATGRRRTPNSIEL